MKTLLDDTGRIEVPDFVRAKLGVKPGDELALDEENGKWFIRLANPSQSPRGSCRQDRVGDESPCPEPSRTILPPADPGTDDLHWEELDYKPVPLKHVGQVAIQFEHRGTLKPMAHHLDEE